MLNKKLAKLRKQSRFVAEAKKEPDENKISYSFKTYQLEEQKKKRPDQD